MWELAQKYRVVLVVDADYRDDVRFKRICERLGLTDIVYREEPPSIVSRHIYLAELARETIDTYTPTFLFQHHYSDVCNAYFFTLNRKLNPSCENVVYNASQMDATPEDRVYLNHRMKEYPRLVRESVFCRSVFRVLQMCKYVIRNSVNFYLLPFCTIRSTIQPITVPYTLTPRPRSGRHIFDHYLVYYEHEKELALRYYNAVDKGVIILCPAAGRCSGVNDLLYGEVEPAKVVLAMPSNLGFFPIESVEREAWFLVGALKILRRRLTQFRFRIKFHPGTDSSPYLEETKEYLLSEAPFLEVVGNDVPAEWRILESEIIIGDVSLALAWAELVGNKTVIGLDCGKREAKGDIRYLKYNRGITYFDNLEDIEEFDLERRLSVSSHRDSDVSIPTLGEFMESIHP